MTKTHRLIPNVEYKRLVERVGPAAAAILMGISQSQASALKGQDEIRAVYEKYAGVLNRQQVGPPALLAVKVPADKVEMVKMFLKGAECGFMEWK
jgi:hypothetical protein